MLSCEAVKMTSRWISRDEFIEKYVDHGWNKDTASDMFVGYKGIVELSPDGERRVDGNLIWITNYKEFEKEIPSPKTGLPQNRRQKRSEKQAAKKQAKLESRSDRLCRR